MHEVKRVYMAVRNMYVTVRRMYMTIRSACGSYESVRDS